MRRLESALLNDLSTADLKRLLAARERIDVLQKEKARLLAALEKIDHELESLVASALAAAGGAAGKRSVGTKTTRKKVVRRKVKKKPLRKKSIVRKAGKKKTVGKKIATKKKTAGKKTVKKAAAKKVRSTKKKVQKKNARQTKVTGAGGRGSATGKTLEEVIVTVLRRAGAPVSYKDLFATIVGKKLFRTRSKNFDNVMRRTLSTSEKVKRVARGVYALA